MLSVYIILKTFILQHLLTSAEKRRDHSSFDVFVPADKDVVKLIKLLANLDIIIIPSAEKACWAFI